MKGKWILPDPIASAGAFFGVKSPHLRGLGGENPTGMGAFWGGYGSSGALRMDLGPFWGRFGAFWGGFGGALGRFEVIWGHFGADLGGFGGGFHPITPCDPTEGALHARSLHPGHQWGRAGPHLHRPPLPYGRRGDQQVPFWGGRGAKKNPTNVGFLGGYLFYPFFPIFALFSPFFTPFSRPSAPLGPRIGSHGSSNTS